MILILLSFISGVLTVFAPCVLPLLPIIIGGSLGDEKDSKQKLRPYIVAGSLIVSLVAFTLLLKASTVLINVDPSVWIYISGGIVIALGFLSLFPGAWEQFIGRMGWQAKSQEALGAGYRNKNWFVGPVITGAALGPVFASCSPTYVFIIATILPRNFAEGLVYLFFYCLGLAVVLLGIAVFGQKFIAKFKWAADPHGKFRRGLGIVFVVVGLSIVTGFDKKTQEWLIIHSPFDITKVEQKLFDSTQNNNEGSVKGSTLAKQSIPSSQYFNIEPVAAPELEGLQTWINSEPLTLAELKGKVVLIDFWTYSCINCVRTLPYVQGWYDTYKDKGFVVLGIHAPEFGFERVEKNVRQATLDRKLTYPIALDNDFATWRAYSNQYWPAHYLIDKEGNIRRTHFGEGKYAETEVAIQYLLGDDSRSKTSYGELPTRQGQTPETYLGIARAERFASSPALTAGEQDYKSRTIQSSQWSIEGSWTASNDNIAAGKNAQLSIKPRAKSVYIVASNSQNGGTITVEVDGKLLKTLQISNNDIYTAAEFSEFGEHLVTLRPSSGIKLYAFTFGS